MKIPIIDLFAGPGGLGEGFSSYTSSSSYPFQIALSIEKDTAAHKTLKTRALIRQFKKEIPEEYYNFLRSDKSGFADYLDSSIFKKEIQRAESEARNLTLGPDNCEIETLIKERLGNRSDFVLIGGPPCQAYSLAGRSRMMGNENFASDERHTLYEHYLQMLAKFQPSVFVMENVKGILSSKLDGELVFDRIRKDLSQPGVAVNAGKGNSLKYNIYSFTNKADLTDFLIPTDYIIKSESFGIPQERHGVILLGIRADKDVGLSSELILKHESAKFSIADTIGDLPKLRSRISKKPDSFERWVTILSELQGLIKIDDHGIKTEMQSVIGCLEARKYKPKVGGRFIEKYMRKERGVGRFLKENWSWFHDERIGGIINHETRSHMKSDLQRYLWCSIFAQVHKRSPRLPVDFPNELLPNHKNVKQGEQTHFPDRFKVQLSDSPSKTITSHISKDGHYFIHYDPLQCRSLTVREAARIQTFPDNYFFEGNRTQQFHQIGNAVPPLLARQLAHTVYKIMEERGEV